MRAILQSHLPIAPWMQEHTRRLPGLNPVEPGEWLLVDDAYAAQMEYREHLLATRPSDVLRMSEGATEATRELLALVLEEVALIEGFTVGPVSVQRPDGIEISIDRENPMETLGKIAQEDFVIMQQIGDEHVLTAAVLCFPAGWTLAEKFMRPMTAIHDPVPEYDADIAKRVQRMFDRIQVDRPMWRANYLSYSNPDLYQPRAEGEARATDEDADLIMRSERQTLRKLPKSGAVIFTIHTYNVRHDDLDAEQLRTLKADMLRRKQENQ